MDRSCVEHSIVSKFATDAQDLFVTTDYILAETLTLLRARRLHDEAFELGERILAQRVSRLVWVTPEDVQKGWILFQYRDKAWSFVDCVSFAVAQRLRIHDAFAFDEHFRQLGTLTVFPE